ncbi:MAG: ATP-binding protein [Desulfitobacterium hafniense]|nr:ATP-binding protein [Desulfitobacterium hafniense]
MIFRSIVTKLWLSIIILMVTVLLVLGTFLGQKFEQFYYDLQAENLINKGLVISEGLTKGRNVNLMEDEIKAFAAEAKATILIAEPSGLVRMCTKMGMGRGAMMHLTPDEVVSIQKGEIVVSRGSHPHFQQAMLSVAIPVRKGQEIDMAVFLYAPLQPMTETANEIRTVVFTGAAGAVVLATILALVLSKTISRPLLAINRAAAQMIQGNFQEKVEVTTQDEIGLLGQTLNVLSSELDNTLRDLSTEKNQLNNILSSMTDGVISFNPDGIIIMINPPAQELMGAKAEEVVGRLLNDCCPVPEIKDMFNSVITEGDIQKQEVSLNDKILAVRMAPLREKGGEIRGAVAVVQDVTRERKLETMRRDFVANVSHELRTPLTLMKGYGEALLEGLGEDRAARAEMVGIMVDESSRMQRLVNDLLDLAHLESGTFKLKMEPVTLCSLLERTGRKFATLAREKNIELITEIAGDIPEVQGDEDRLEQVFTNLLDNAFRHTDREGMVKIRAYKEESRVAIQIADTGKGIPADELPFIFERFYKVEKSRNRKVAGTGLGLAIARTIIQAHGGSITAESREGEGTVFEIRI